MTIGERIKIARENAHISQTELADKIDISRQLMYRYESGKVTNIPSDKIELISDICHVSPAFIMGWDEVPENGQQQYYLNDETAKLAQEVYENPDLKLVFDACKDLTPEQIQAAAALLKSFKGGQ